MPEHDLQVRHTLLTDLHQHPDNANMGDVDAIEQSIRINGLYAPLLIQKSSNRIIAGNHRYVVALKMGLTTVPTIELDVDDEQALRIMLADNRTTRLGRDDESQLYEILDLLRSTDAGFAGTGYEYDDFAALSEIMESPLTFEQPETTVQPLDTGKGLIYETEPIVDDDGVVYSFVVYKPGSKRLSAHDLNTVRTAFGQTPFTKEQIDELSVGSWSHA
jgi:hypothetical protein